MSRMGAHARRQKECCGAWMQSHIWTGQRRQRTLGAFPFTTQHKETEVLESWTARGKL